MLLSRLINKLIIFFICMSSWKTFWGKFTTFRGCEFSRCKRVEEFWRWNYHDDYLFRTLWCEKCNWHKVSKCQLFPLSTLPLLVLNFWRQCRRCRWFVSRLEASVISQLFSISRPRRFLLWLDVVCSTKCSAGFIFLNVTLRVSKYGSDVTIFQDN